jgi:glutaredoxin
MPSIARMMRRLLAFWGMNRVAATEDLHLCMFTRRGCHLCEDVWALLERAQRRHHFLLESVDVDSDADLRARFGDQVPVVTVNGKVRFRGGVNEVLLERLLAAEAAKQTRKIR